MGILDTDKFLAIQDANTKEWIVFLNGVKIGCQRFSITAELKEPTILRVDQILEK